MHKTHKSMIFVPTPPLCMHLYICFELYSLSCVILYVKMAQATTYSFEAKISSRGYQVYKNTT